MYGRSRGGVSPPCGRDGRENAGMSNEKTGEIPPVRRKPEVSRVKVIYPRVSRPPLRRGREP